MTEWGVVTVIVALVGLIATVAAPIVKLTGTINTLSGKVELLLRIWRTSNSATKRRWKSSRTRTSGKGKGWMTTSTALRFSRADSRKGMINHV